MGLQRVELNSPFARRSSGGRTPPLVQVKAAYALVQGFIGRGHVFLCHGCNDVADVAFSADGSMPEALNQSPLLAAITNGRLLRAFPRGLAGTGCPPQGAWGITPTHLVISYFPSFSIIPLEVAVSQVCTIKQRDSFPV